MSKVVTVPLDDELEVLLNQMLQARRMKVKSQVIREAIWEYAQKILNQNTTIEVIKRQS